MEKCKQKKSAYQKLLERNKGVRGIRRIKMDLEDIYGKIMNRKKISRIMKELNLRTKIKDEICLIGLKTFEQVIQVIEDYMYYYNKERRQWNKSKMTPVEYRKFLLAS